MYYSARGSYSTRGSYNNVGYSDIKNNHNNTYNNTGYSNIKSIRDNTHTYVNNNNYNNAGYSRINSTENNSGYADSNSDFDTHQNGMYEILKYSVHKVGVLCVYIKDKAVIFIEYIKNKCDNKKEEENNRQPIKKFMQPKLNLRDPMNDSCASVEF